VDLERSLISKIVNEKDYTAVAELGVTRDMFYGSKNKEVFDRIKEVVNEHGSVPSAAILQRDWPTYKFIEEVEEPFSLLVEEIKENHALTIFESALGEAADAYDKEDLDRIQAILSRALTQVSETSSNALDINLRGSGQERLDRYEEMQNRDADEYLGIPMGFETIDRATQGWQPGQFVLFVGPPKAGKSTIMLLAGRAAWKNAKSVLIIGFEMSNEEQFTRFDAIEAGIDHSVLRGGKDKRLTDKDWEDLEDAIDAMDASDVDFILSNDTHNNTTLSGIAAKIDKYKPDMVIVDGMYMMQDENGEKPGSPQALTNITRGLKRMAQNKQVPIVGTTQVLEWKMDKKKGIQSDSIGYSSSFAQDADAIIGVEKTDDETINKVKIVIARNSPPKEVYVRWDWEKATFEELAYNPFEDDDEGGDDGYEANF